MSKHKIDGQGVCSKEISFELRDGRVHDVVFTGGCRGALRATAKLLEGMAADMAIETLRSIKCRNNTSCPAELAKLIEKEQSA